jgi:hypothetical protein
MKLAKTELKPRFLSGRDLKLADLKLSAKKFFSLGMNLTPHQAVPHDLHTILSSWDEATPSSGA